MVAFTPLPSSQLSCARGNVASQAFWNRCSWTATSPAPSHPDVSFQSPGPHCSRGPRRGSHLVLAVPAGASNDRTVFSTKPGRECTFQEAQEARDACKLLSGEPRAECYASFGCDAERVDSYLDDVVHLEDALPEGRDWIGDSVRFTGQVLVTIALGCLMILEIFWNVGVSTVMAMQALGMMISDFVQQRTSSWSLPGTRTAAEDPNDGKYYCFDSQSLTFKEYSGSQVDKKLADSPEGNGQ